MHSLSETAIDFHNKSIVIDLHAHPALKTFLFNKQFYKKHRTGGAWNPLAMRVDLPKISEGGLNAVFSSVYLIEKEMIYDCGILSFVVSLFGLFSKKFRNLKKFRITFSYYFKTWEVSNKLYLTALRSNFVFANKLMQSSDKYIRIRIIV